MGIPAKPIPCWGGRGSAKHRIRDGVYGLQGDPDDRPEAEPPPE